MDRHTDLHTHLNTGSGSDGLANVPGISLTAKTVLCWASPHEEPAKFSKISLRSDGSCAKEAESVRLSLLSPSDDLESMRSLAVARSRTLSFWNRLYTSRICAGGFACASSPCNGAMLDLDHASHVKHGSRGQCEVYT